MSEHKCEGRIWAGLHFHPCGKTARYEHEGKWYCKRHHPPTEQAKRDARSKKFREEFESRQQASREAEKARAEMQRKAAAYEGLVAQRDALKQTLHDELAGNLRLRDLGGARPDEPMLTFLERIIAERDALLAALKSTGLFLHHCWCDVQMNDYSFEKLNRQMEIVDAAIKAVEKGK